MLLHRYANTASPIHIMLGVNEQSARKRVIDPAGDPQHYPLLFLRTHSGLPGKLEVSPSAAAVVYGLDTFLPNSKYDSVDHVIARQITAEGNAIQIVRTNNDPALVAGINVFAVVTTATTNVTKVGDNVTIPSGIDIDVASVSYITTPIDVNVDTIVATAEAAGHKIFKVFGVKTTSSSEDYLNIGLTIDPIVGPAVNKKSLDKDGLTFSMALKEKKETGVVSINTLMSDPYAEFMLKERGLDPISKVPKDLASVLPGRWENDVDVHLPITYREIEDIVVDNTDIIELLTYLKGLEVTARAALPVELQSELTEQDVESIWNINPFTMRNIDDLPYLASVKGLVDTSIYTAYKPNVIDMGPSTPFFLRCNAYEMDNTVYDAMLSQDHHEAYIRDYMTRYDDENHPVMDLASNTETAFWDGQYSMPTKVSLSRAISLRKDTYVGFTTMVHSDIGRGIEVPIFDHNARAAYLMTAIRLMPDSTTYNTSAIRAFIVMGDGKMKNGQYRDYKPQLVEVAKKIAAYAGASNGELKAGKEFDSQPGNIIDSMIDLRPREMGNGTKMKLYENGVIWSQKANRIEYFFPQMQSVYSDDTAIVNNVEYIIIISTLTRYADETWRMFTGSIKDTNEIIEDIEIYFSRRAKGKFNRRAKIKPKAFITGEDEASGTGIHLDITLFGYNSKTRLTTTITTKRWESVN